MNFIIQVLIFVYFIIIKGFLLTKLGDFVKLYTKLDNLKIIYQKINDFDLGYPL